MVSSLLELQKKDRGLFWNAIVLIIAHFQEIKQVINNKKDIYALNNYHQPSQNDIENGLLIFFA